MARARHLLNASSLRTLPPGSHNDGGRLRLVITEPGHGHWLQKVTFRGRDRELGLGTFPAVTLGMARDRADEHRRMIAAGVDPLAAKRRAEADAAPRPTLADAIDAWIAHRSPGWAATTLKSTTSLVGGIKAEIGARSIDELAEADVRSFLTSRWKERTDSATKQRRIIEQVVDYAVVVGLRPREMPNPACWRGQLSVVLAPPKKVRPPQHLAAVDWQDMPALWRELQARDGIGVAALSLTILTACRSNEILGLLWREVDLDKRIATIPASRMKARKAHTIPLPAAAVVVVRRMAEVRRNEFVFPGGRKDRLSAMTMTAILRRMGRSDVTVHGFRSSFSTWCQDNGIDRDVREACLAHLTGSVERAYARSTMLGLRAEVMQKWADYVCGSEIGTSRRHA